MGVLNDDVTKMEKMREAWNNPQAGQQRFFAQCQDGLVVDVMASNGKDVNQVSRVFISPPLVAEHVHVSADAKGLASFDALSGRFLCYKLT